MSMVIKKPTAGIILAAGMSTRFGRPKQLLKIGTEPLIRRVLKTALASRLDSLFLVLGHKHREISVALGENCQDQRVEVIINRRYKEGLSSSLKAGLRKAEDKYPSVMFLTADQPMLDADTIDRLLEHFWNTDRDICVPVFKGRRGHPVIFSDRFYPLLRNAYGDIGARFIIDAHPDRVLRVELHTPNPLLDVDTETDLKSLWNDILTV